MITKKYLLLKTLLIVVTILIGIFSRLLNTGLVIIDEHLGDALYAVLVLLILNLKFAFIKSSVYSLLICFVIEFFQLTGIPSYMRFSDNILYKIIGFALGTTFNPVDLVTYAIGIFFAVVLYISIRTWTVNKT